MTAKKDLQEEWVEQVVAVGATDKKTNRNATLLALSSAALTLPGVAAKAATPVETPKATTQFGYYQEEGDRMKAQVYHADFIVPVNDWMEFTFSFDQDTYVGATPSYSVPAGTSDAITAASDIDPFSLGVTTIANPRFIPLLTDINADIASGKLAAGTDPLVEMFKRLIETPRPNFNKPVQVFTEHPLETRNMPILGANFYYGPLTFGITGGYSLEPDFESVFGSGNFSLELNNKLTTISGGYSLANNFILREAVTLGGPHDHSEGEIPDFEATNTYRTVNLGLSQILTKNTLFHLNASYTRQRGYLSNPYKLVNIRGEITPEEYKDAAFVNGGTDSSWDAYTDLEVAGFELFREVRPDKRDQWVISAGINQHIPELDATVHFDYRYYQDNWDINSHTFELAWYQQLPYGFTVTPNIRYYSQSEAKFFAPFFLAPRADGFYSSDYRLSGYGKLSGGLTVSKEFSKGIRLDASVEYSTHQGSLKLGGGGENEYADIDSVLLSAALHMDLASIGNLAGEHNEHGTHIRHSGNPPAGVMYGHMLKQAGDFMVGYNYMYSDWSSGIQQGTTTGISDQTIISNACAGGDCSFKPRRMEMHMHMLNFMYAPTDWLNLMLMPTFSYMKMEMEALPNQLDAEGGYHESTGLGDTQLGALIKLFDYDDHHMHLGFIFSAPTGRTDITFDGFLSEDSALQSFGMQLGSGTWDFKPSLTYMGHHERWSWGAQVSATIRMEDSNRRGYALGDEIQGSIWGGYRAFDWLSFSLRNVYKVQGSIRGTQNRIIPLELGEEPQLTPLENPANYGGKFWDIGIGLNLSIPGSEYSGHHLSVEWLQPVIHDLNGFQLEREGTLAVKWGYAF